LFVGIEKEEIDTPALLIDLDCLDKNIKIMADYYRGKGTACLLPHQKGHRLPIIAKKQVQHGARGVSMTSFGLAEFYAHSGVDNILITAEITGPNKIRRLCALSKQANVTVGVDDIRNARQLSEMARAYKTRVNVAVELYMGKGSCGVEIHKTKSFVKRLSRLQGLAFKGLWWHQGSLARMKRFDQRKEAHFGTLEKVAELKDDIEDGGVNVEMLSGGYTCTWNITPEYQKLRDVEVQAGSYVFSDWCSHNLEGLEVFDFALTVLTRCISRPRPDQAVFDFGMNSCSDECGHDYLTVVGPRFKDLRGVAQISEREEISLAVLEDPCSNVRVGDVFELIPPHSDTTTKLYDRYYVVRDGKVEQVWANHGRGLL
jgi:3-hydroxy-D-aspartate aldolase